LTNLYAKGSLFIGIISSVYLGITMRKFLIPILLLIAGCQEAIEDEEVHVQTQQIKTNDITINFPVKIKAESLFEIALEFPQNVEIISSKLVSISMDMGIIPVFFQEKKNTSYLTAQLLVGACSLPSMQWRLDIQWKQNGQRKFFSQMLDIKR